MYYTLKRLFDSKRLPAENLKKAVSAFGWIDETQYKQITGEEYSTTAKATASSTTAASK